MGARADCLNFRLNSPQMWIWKYAKVKGLWNWNSSETKLLEFKQANQEHQYLFINTELSLKKKKERKTEHSGTSPFLSSLPFLNSGAVNTNVIVI